MIKAAKVFVLGLRFVFNLGFGLLGFRFGWGFI